MPVISFTGTPMAINAGSASTLAWTVGNGPTSVTLSPGLGTVGASGSTTVTPVATTTYTLTATNLAGTVTANVTINVTRAPVITSFTAAATQINQGGSTTLTWSATGATLTQVNGLTVSGATLVIAPTQTTTYTLSVSNSAGSASQSVTVTVVIPASFQWQKAMVYGFGQLLSEESSTGPVYVMGDQVGSPNILTDATGTVVGLTKNLPFGERLDSWGVQSARRYTNHEDQPGSAIYMQARMYLPAYGKFAQVDPVYDQTKGDPETWNLYNYVTNNPVTHTDPDGREAQQSGDNPNFGFMHTIRGTMLGCASGGEDFWATGAQTDGWDCHVTAYYSIDASVSTGHPAPTVETKLSPWQQTNHGADGKFDPHGDQAKAEAIKAGEVSGEMVGKVAVFAYGGSLDQRTGELSAIKTVLTDSDQGKAMLSALEDRKTWFGLGSVKSFDLISMDSGGSHTFLGSQRILLDQHDVGASYKSLDGNGTFSYERIIAHELGHAAMGTRDDGPGRMNNVNANENVVMRQLGDSMIE